jgi:adenylate cyclase
VYSWRTVLITIGVFVGLKIWSPYLVENIKWSYFDVLHQSQEKVQVDDIVLVDIDEKSLEVFGQYPIKRSIYRDILLDTHYTNTHVFTQLFNQPDRNQGEDEIFAEGLVNRLTILSAAPTIQKDTGSAPFVGNSTFGGGSATDHLWNFSGISSPIRILQDNTYGVGVTVATPSVSGTPNFDGTTRSIPLIVTANEQVYPSLALETLRAFKNEPSYQTKITEVGVEWVRMGRDKPITTTPTSDVMVSYWNEFQRVSAVDLPNLNLTNKILIWGLTAEGLNNPVSTPVGILYPHEVQANHIQTSLSGVQIQQSYYLELLEVVLLLTVLVLILLMVYKLPTVLSGVMSLGLVGLQVGGSYYIWTSELVLFDTFFSSVASLIVFGHASFNQYYTTYKLKEEIKKQFQKYLSPDMVDQLAENPDLLKLGGDRKELTFMFMDICGFTPISEHYMKQDDPEGLVELINKFLDMQTKIILNNNGTIDKYMGDCIMSFWNAPLDCPDHAEMAVKSAEEILIATKELNEELKPLNLPPINVGIGINTGECIVGNMGSELRFDYSVIGDAVNLGARLEGQTRNYDGVDVLLGEATYLQCPNRTFTKVDSITVKGKSEPVTVYTI